MTADHEGVDPWRARFPSRGSISGFLVRLAGIALILGSLHVLGIFELADERLRGVYYRVRGTRPSQFQVLVVAADDATVAAWGAPPWDWSRYRSLFVPPLAAGARLVAVMEPGPRVRPFAETEPPRDLAQATTEGRLVLPPPAGELGPRAVRTALGRPVDGVLPPVNFLGGPATLPTVSALRVAAGDIPAEVFRDKVVVFGITSRLLSPVVETPVGSMTPVELDAHALLALADGVAWWTPGRAARVLLALLLAIAVLVWSPRLDVAKASGLCLALALLSLGVDYALFTCGVALWGASAPILAVIVAGCVSWLHERRHTHQQLGTMATWMARRVRSDADAQLGDEAFWRRVLEVTHLCVGATSCLFADLPAGGSRVVLRHLIGASPDVLAERRRDVGRSPFRQPHLTLRVERSEGFLRPGLGVSSVFVPLLASRVETSAPACAPGSRILGFWIVNFPDGVNLTKTRVDLLERLAREVARSLEKRGPDAPLPAKLGLTDVLLGNGPLWGQVQEIQRSVESLAQRSQERVALLDRMPFGVLVASLWGEVQVVTGLMRGALEAEGVSDLAGKRLADLLVALTGKTPSEIDQLTLTLFAVGAETRLALRLERPSASEFVLARGEGADATVLVLTATRRTAPVAELAPAASELHQHEPDITAPFERPSA